MSRGDLSIIFDTKWYGCPLLFHRRRHHQPLDLCRYQRLCHLLSQPQRETVHHDAVILFTRLRRRFRLLALSKYIPHRTTARSHATFSSSTDGIQTWKRTCLFECPSSPGVQYSVSTVNNNNNNNQ